MAGTSDDLYDAAAEWLTACSDALAATFGGSIERVYVTDGLPSFDCPPELTVHAGGVVVGDTAPLQPPLSIYQRITITGAIPLATFTCSVIRCNAVLDDEGDPPPTADIERVARETMADLWAIWNTTRALHRKNLLFASPSGDRFVEMGAPVPIPPQGGASGWQIPVTIELAGYDPTAS